MKFLHFSLTVSNRVFGSKNFPMSSFCICLYIKKCLMKAVNGLCSKNSDLLASIRLLIPSVVRKMKHLERNVLTITEKIMAVTLDESAVLMSTSQLLIFIRGISLDFHITKKLISVCSMHGTTRYFS